MLAQAWAASGPWDRLNQLWSPQRPACLPFPRTSLIAAASPVSSACCSRRQARWLGPPSAPPALAALPPPLPPVLDAAAPPPCPAPSMNAAASGAARATPPPSICLVASRSMHSASGWQWHFLHPAPSCLVTLQWHSSLMLLPLATQPRVPHPVPMRIPADRLLVRRQRPDRLSLYSPSAPLRALPCNPRGVALPVCF